MGGVVVRRHVLPFYRGAADRSTVRRSGRGGRIVDQRMAAHASVPVAARRRMKLSRLRPPPSSSRVLNPLVDPPAIRPVKPRAGPAPSPPPRDPPGDSGAHGAVDALADEVGVPVVPGV